MQKIKEFIKNYKKILIGGLIGLIFVFACTIMLHSVLTRKEIRDTNNVQLEKIYHKATFLENAWEGVTKVFDNPAKRDIQVIYNLLQLEPDDAYDQDYINNCVEYITGINNLIILDEDRNIINASGEIRGIDYTKPYYDGFSASPNGVITTIDDEGSEFLKTIGIKSDDIFILTQIDDNTQTIPSIDDEVLWKVSKLSVGLDSDSRLVVEDLADNSILFSEIEWIGVDDLAIKQSSSKNYTTEDGSFLVQYFDSDDGDIRLYALTPNTAIAESGQRTLILIMIIILFVLVILIAYIVCLRQDELDPTKEYKFLGKYFLHTQTNSFRAISIVIGILITIVFLFFSSVSESEFDRTYLVNEAEQCAEVYTGYAEVANNANDMKNELMFGYGRMAGHILNEHEEYQSKSGMISLADAFNVTGLSAFDSAGNTVCTSSPLDNLNVLADPDSSLYKLGLALMGKEGVVVEGDSETLGEDVFIYGVPWRNTEGIADGMITITALYGLTDTAAYAMDEEIYEIIEKSRLNSYAQVFFVNNYGAIILNEQDLDIDSEISEETMVDGYSGVLTINDEDYLCAVKLIEETGDYLYVVKPITMIKPNLLINVIALDLMYILLALWIWYDGLGSKFHFEERKNKIKDADDWERTELYWDELSISKKMGKIFCICTYVFTIFFVLMAILVDLGVVENKTFSAIFSGIWNDSLNGYSIIYNICIICVFFTGTRFVEYILMKIEQIIGSDGVTLSRLAGSLLKYLSALICIYIVVTNFGVDAAAAIASIGIVGFALTFGAQELIKDMISGMFILFEGNFKVGDMLDVDGEWYWIKSIGMRTTTLDAWGSVKVINNSQMTGIINIQDASAVVDCDIWIGNQYNIDEVQTIMSRELPKLKEKLSAEVSTPVWKGIQALSASGTLIRLRAYCPPLYQGWVGRELRYAIKQILDDNGIKLSCKQYNIHYQLIDPKKIREEMNESMQKNIDHAENPEE